MRSHWLIGVFRWEYVLNTVVTFHWLAAFQVDTFLAHSKNSHIFWGNPFSLNELIGYVDLTVFRKIWSEDSLIDIKQNHGGDFPYFKYFPRGDL